MFAIFLEHRRGWGLRTQGPRCGHSSLLLGVDPAGFRRPGLCCSMNDGPSGPRGGRGAIGVCTFESDRVTVLLRLSQAQGWRPGT